MRIENPSTRRGRNPGTFHTDGKAFVGRGRIDPEPMEVGELAEIHDSVFRGLPDRRWAHFSYGGYTPETIGFAMCNNIALFEFDRDCALVPLTTTARWLYNQKPERRRIRNIGWGAFWLVLIFGIVVGIAYLLPNSASGVATVRGVGILFAVIGVLSPFLAFFGDQQMKGDDIARTFVGGIVLGVALIGFSFLWGSVSGV